MAKMEMRRKNRERWIEALAALPEPTPISMTWEGKNAILSALRPFAESGCNHFLLPRMGGLDVASVQSSREPGCIEIVIRDRLVWVVRPYRITLEHFPETPLESFLLLELGELKPSGIYEELAGPKEELVEVDGEYVERSHWDEGTIGEDEDGDPLPLPDDARLVTRFLSGKILVVSTGSIWNSVPATYDGRHSRMEASEIRRQISDVLARLGPDYLEPKTAEV